MSLVDKMNMWASSAQAQSPEPVIGILEPEWPEIVEDDTEDTSSHPELPLYSQAIIGSEAYKLLLEDLRRESSLHSDTSRVWTMDTVRHQIMGGLSPTRISKNQNPCVHNVEFLLSLRGIKERLVREGMRRGLNHHGAYDPASTVVLVSSCNNYTQAATLEEYVDQTWDSRGSRLLELIKSISAEDFKTVDSYCKLDVRIATHTPRIIHLTKTNPTGASGGLDSILHSVSTPDVLSIRAKGLSNSISEYGTELCWVASALQNSDAIVRYSPSVFQPVLESRGRSTHSWILHPGPSTRFQDCQRCKSSGGSTNTSSRSLPKAFRQRGDHQNSQGWNYLRSFCCLLFTKTVSTGLNIPGVSQDQDAQFSSSSRKDLCASGML